MKKAILAAFKTKKIQKVSTLKATDNFTELK